VIRSVIDNAPVSQKEHDAVKRLMALRQADQGWVSRLMSGAADEKREFNLMTVVLNASIQEKAA
jgi:hypothetical protein